MEDYGQKNGRIDRRMDERTDGWRDECTVGRRHTDISGILRTDGGTDVGTDVGMDGKTGEGTK